MITPNSVTDNEILGKLSDAASDQLSELTFFQKRNNSVINALAVATATLGTLAPALSGLHWGYSVAVGLAILVLSTFAQAFTKGALTTSAAKELVARVAMSTDDVIVEEDKGVAVKAERNPFTNFYSNNPVA